MRLCFLGFIFTDVVLLSILRHTLGDNALKATCSLYTNALCDSKRAGTAKGEPQKQGLLVILGNSEVSKNSKCAFNLCGFFAITQNDKVCLFVIVSKAHALRGNP